MERRVASGPADQGGVCDGVACLSRNGRLLAERRDLGQSAEVTHIALGLPAGSTGSRSGTLLFDRVFIHR
jgi:hypothetical protein